MNTTADNRLVTARQVSKHLQREQMALTPLTEARQMQRLLFADVRKQDTKPSDRALLARAWCSLQECIRVMRGLPLPGQYRPEHDAAKLAKQLKQAMRRQPIDIGSRTFNGPSEEPEPTIEATPALSAHAPSQGCTGAEPQKQDQTQ